MKNLLHSGFSRLWRSKLFYLGMLVVAANVTYTLINNLYYKSLWNLTELTGSNLLFAGTQYLPLAIAAFVAFFVGTDHGDRTIRNKITAGYGRGIIYLSHLIVSVTAALLMYVVGSGIVIAVGAPLLGGFSGAPHVLILQLLCSLLTVAAFTALTVLLAMLITNKAVTVIIILLITVGLLFLLTPTLSSILSVPETVGGWSYTDENGVAHEITEQPNPAYLTGFTRQTVQFLYEFLPTGQLFEYGKENALPEGIWRFPLYSLLWIGATATGGIYLFKRKNLK